MGLISTPTKEVGPTELPVRSGTSRDQVSTQRIDLLGYPRSLETFTDPKSLQCLGNVGDRTPRTSPTRETPYGTPSVITRRGRKVRWVWRSEGISLPLLPGQRRRRMSLGEGWSRVDDRRRWGVTLRCFWRGLSVCVLSGLYTKRTNLYPIRVWDSNLVTVSLVRNRVSLSRDTNTLYPEKVHRRRRRNTYHYYHHK